MQQKTAAIQSDLFLNSDAVFSPCRTWRYSLWRRWAPGPAELWMMLNPSTADETDNDPYTSRVIK
jgi:hypothetical protein